MNKGNIVVTLNIADRTDEYADDNTAPDTAPSLKKAEDLNINIADRTDESADDITAADTALSPKKATNLNMNILSEQ